MNEEIINLLGWASSALSDCSAGAFGLVGSVWLCGSGSIALGVWAVFSIPDASFHSAPGFFNMKNDRIMM